LTRSIIFFQSFDEQKHYLKKKKKIKEKVFSTTFLTNPNTKRKMTKNKIKIKIQEQQNHRNKHTIL
jgi:hypothetical protein